MALDGAGNVYVADSRNLEVKEIPLATPPSLTFASTNDGATSSAQTVTVQNFGNATLAAVSPGLGVTGHFTQVAGSGTPPDCTASFSLAPGALCNLTVEFSPVSLDNGSLVGSVVLTDNSLNASPSATQTISLSGTAVAPAVNHFAFAGSPSTATAGVSFTGTVTAYTSSDNSVVATSYTGPVTFTSTDASAVLPGSTTLTAGVSGTLTFTLKTAGTQTITVADASGSPSLTSGSIVVSAGVGATITALSATPQSAVIGAAFSTPLKVQVTDAYSNPVGGAVVTFTTPTTGASATLSSASCTTSTTAPIGVCSVTATANGTASATAYMVTAKAAGVATGASFSLTNLKSTPTVSLSEASSTLVYGQSESLTATFTPARNHASNITPGVSLSQFIFMAGPRYTYNTSRWTDRGFLKKHSTYAFGEWLLGGVHAYNSVFPSSAGTTPSASAFSMQLGGGANVALSKGFGLRILELDYVRTTLPNNGSNSQNDLRIAFGLSYTPKHSNR